MNIIKSPLRYPGGKSKAVPFLSQFVPQDFTEFREPFFGGGSMSLYFAQVRPDATFMASELYYDLYCFWTQLQADPERLIQAVKEKVESDESGKELFFSARTAGKRPGLSDFDLAVNFYILNSTAFSGLNLKGSYSEQAYLRLVRALEKRLNQLKANAGVINKINFINSDYSELVSASGGGGYSST